MEQARQRGFPGATSLLARELWEFVRDSTPARRQQRYGDMDYDWEHRVNTTSGTVAWRERLLGLFHSAYQPTEPEAFREMMAALPISFPDFTFVDLGSGKGRTLLLASEYPFHRIVGVEILPELHRAAEENIRAYRGSNHTSVKIESVLMDAGDFEFPPAPLVSTCSTHYRKRGCCAWSEIWRNRWLSPHGTSGWCITTPCWSRLYLHRNRWGWS